MALCWIFISFRRYAEGCLQSAVIFVLVHTFNRSRSLDTAENRDIFEKNEEQDMSKDEEDKSNIGEHATPYESGKKMHVRTFESFEEMNEADTERMADTPATERIRSTVELILRTYGLTREELKDRNRKHKLIIAGK